MSIHCSGFVIRANAAGWGCTVQLGGAVWYSWLVSMISTISMLIDMCTDMCIDMWIDEAVAVTTAMAGNGYTTFGMVPCR